MTPQRLPGNPIIRPHMDDRMGSNINGPSLIRAPSWLPRPLGQYYLYFAHHGGDYIRLAYADDLNGPWTTHRHGTLQLEDSFCCGHVASPDVHVDNARKEIRMYYHGPSPGRGQVTRVAVSHDGIDFSARPEILGASYFRVFLWKGRYYALGMPGEFYRSADGLSGFVKGPTRFTPNMRHSALWLKDGDLRVFYSNAFDCPERILVSAIPLTEDWTAWRETEPRTVLEPERDYEGGNLPLTPSKRGWAPEPVRQLRDPAVFEENGRVYLLYSVAGERGIAIAELIP